MTLFDLSHPLTPGMPVYPADPEVSFTPDLTIAPDGVAVTAIAMGTHTGTHLDAPAHIDPDGLTVEQLELELLHGPAHIVQLLHPPQPAAPIRLKDLNHLPDQLPKIVCVATGWDRYFHDPMSQQHPYLDPALVKLCWQRGARVLGIDTWSPDPSSPTSGDLAVHHFWLGNGGIIVENLRNLTALPDQVQMSLLPLPLTGCDGAPVRAIAWRG